MGEPPYPYPTSNNNLPLSIHAFGCAIRLLLGEKRSRSWNYGLWSDANVKAIESTFFCRKKNRGPPLPSLSNDQSPRRTCMKEEAETPSMHVLVKPSSHSPSPSESSHNKREIVSVIVEFLLNAENFEMEKLLGELLTTNCNAHDCEDHVHVCDGVVCGETRSANTTKADECTDEIECVDNEAKVSFEQCCWSTFLRRVQETAFFSGGQAQLDEVRGAPATSHASNRLAVNENGGRRSRIPRNKLAPSYTASASFASLMTSSPQDPTFGRFTAAPATSVPPSSAVLLNPLSDIFFISPFLASIFPALTNCFLLNEVARDHHHHPEESMTEDTTDENLGSGDFPSGEGNGLARGKESSRFEETKNKNKKGCGGKWHGYSFLFDTRVADDLKKIFVENGVIMMECILSHGYDPFHFISNAPQLFIKKFGLAGLRLLFAHGLDPHYTTAEKLEEFGFVDSGREDQKKATSLTSYHLPYQTFVNEKEGEGEDKGECSRTLFSTSLRLGNSFFSSTLPFPMENGKRGEEKEPNHSSQLSSQGTQSHNSTTTSERTKVLLRHAAHQYIICSVLFSSYCRERNHFAVLMRSAAEAGCAPPMAHQTYASEYASHPSVAPLTTAYPFSTIHYTNDLPPPTATLLHACADLCLSEPFSKFAAGALPNKLHLRLPLPPALGGDEASSTLSSAVSSLDNYKGEEENDCTFIPSFSSSSSTCASATSSSAYPYISEKDPLASLLLILGEGADPDSKDSFLRTPLHLAKSSEAVFALFASGAAINAVDFLGNNAFHLVVSKDNRLCLSCALATCGCDLGAINIRGWTPFMEAVLKCSAPDLALTVRSEQIIELWRRIRLGPRHMRFLAPHFSSVLENLLRRCHSLPTSDMHGNEGVRLKLESQMHQGGHSTLLKKKQELENAERASTTNISLTPRGEPNDVTHASTLSIGPLADHKNNFTIAHALVLRLINNGDSGNIVISSFLKRCLTPLPSTTTASNINSKVSSPSSSSCFSSSSCAFPNSNTAAFLSLSFTLSSSDSIALQTELTTSDVRIDLDDGITQHPFRVRRELQAKTKTIGGRNGISVNSSDNTGTNSSAFTLTLRKKSSPLHLAALINAIDAIKPIVTAICAAAATTGGTYNTATTTSTTTLPDVDRDDDEDDAQEHEHVMKGKEEEINERQKRRGLSQHSIPTVLGLVDEDGRTCLHVAAERGHDAFIHLLLTESFTLNLLTYACAQCAGPAKYASLLGKCLSGEKTHQGEAVEKSHRRFVSPSDITCDALGEMRCGVGTAAATVHVASSSTGGSKEALHHICRAKTVAKGCGLNGLSSSSSSSSAAFSSSSRSSPPDLANTNEDYDVSHTKSTEGSEGKKNVGHTQQQQQRSDRRRVARSPFAGVPRCAANAHLYDSSSSSSTSDDDRGTIRTRGTARAKAGGQPQPNPLLRRPRGVVSLSSSSDSDDLCDPPLLGNRLLFVPPTSSLSSPLCANAPSFILSSCPRANDSVIVEKDNDNDEVAAEVAMQETKARLPLLRVVEARDANGETAADIAMRGLAQLVDEYRLAEEAPVGSTNGGRLNSAFSVLTLSLYSSSSSSSSSEDTTDDEGGKEEEERHLHGKQWRTTAAQSTFKTDSTTTVDSSADPNSSNCTSHSMMRRRRRWIKKLKRAFADRALAYLRIVFTLRTFARDKKDEEKNPLGTPKREGGASGTHTVVGNDRGLLPHIIALAAEKIIGMKTNQKATSLFSQLRSVLGPPDIDGTTFLTRSDALAFLEEARRLLRISRNDSNKREGTGSSTFTCTHPTTHSIIPQQPQPQKKSDICSEATSTANTTLIRRMVVANACKRSRGDANESGEGRPHRQVLPSASSSSSICQHNVVSCCCATCESDDDGNESRSKRHISESKKHFA